MFYAYFIYHFLYMRAEQCVSITELRKKTGAFIGKDSLAEQFVFIGSRPTNVLLTMERYEELRKIEDMLYERNLDLQFSPYDSLSEAEKTEHNTAINRDNSTFVDF